MQRGPIDGECAACPAGATCTISGDIMAAGGQYLIIDQQAATVAAVRCSSSACLNAAAQCPATDDLDASARQQQQQPMSQLISASQLRVLNCCDAGRWPAYVNTSFFVSANDSNQTSTPQQLPDGIVDSDGVNVLCAHCLPGYSSVNGRCVECSSVQWGALFGLLLLALLLVYAVHRLPHDWTGSATLSIVSYFVQLSAIYKASDLLPQLSALVNFQLLGGFTSSSQSAVSAGANGGSVLAVCVAPLDDVGRVRMAFAAPVIAVGLLGVVAMLQAAMHVVLTASSRQDGRNGDGDAADHSHSPVNHTQSWVTGWRVYGWLFVPVRLRTQRVVAAEHSESHVNATVSFERRLVEERNEPLIADERPLAQQQCPAHTSASRLAAWRSYQRSIVRLLLLSYSGLSLVALSCLHWQQVGEYGWRLTDFPTVSPGGNEWRTLLPGVVVMMAVVVSAPLAMLLFFWHQHCGGYIAEAKQKLQLFGCG